MRTPPGHTDVDDWRPLLASSANTILCTHIWRCVLLLLLRQEFAAALVCVQALAVVGDSRVVNAACGRYIAFFLHQLLERVQRPESVDPERDEELMVYASGDMQGSNDGSWAWQGSETGSQLEAALDGPPPHPHPGGRDNLSTGEAESWEGWEWVEKTIQYFLSEKQRQQAQPQPMDYEQRPVSPRVKSSESAYPSPERPASTDEAAAQRTASRMTIASII
jgi:hypothetical protein